MVNQGESIIIDGQEYLCVEKVELDGKQYLYLVNNPGTVEFCFAEQSMADDKLQVRIIGSRDEKIKILNALQAKIKQNAKT